MPATPKFGSLPKITDLPLQEAAMIGNRIEETRSMKHVVAFALIITISMIVVLAIAYYFHLQPLSGQ